MILIFIVFIKSMIKTKDGNQTREKLQVLSQVLEIFYPAALCITALCINNTHQEVKFTLKC